MVLFGCKEDKEGEIITLLPEQPKPEIGLKEARETTLSNIEELKDTKITFRKTDTPWSERLTYHKFIYSHALLLALKHLPKEFNEVLDDVTFIRIDNNFPRYSETSVGTNYNQKIYLREFLVDPRKIIEVFYHELCHSYDRYYDIRARYRRIQHFDRYPNWYPLEKRSLDEKFAYSCDRFLMGNFTGKHEKIRAFFQEIFVNYDSTSLINEINQFQLDYENILKIIKN